MDKRDVAGTLLLSAILLILAFLVSQTVGLGAGGFDTDFILQQYTFYLSGAVFMGIILLVYFFRRLLSDEDEYGDSVAYSSIGKFPALSFFSKIGAVRLFFGSAIIFSLLGLFAVRTGQTAFTAFRVLEQQFTPVGQLMYSALLIPIAENLGLAAVIAAFITAVAFYADRSTWSRPTFGITVILFTPLVAGLYGLINHLLRYGGSDIALLIVFIFWAVGGLITVLTGSFIPFWVMHLMNNLLYDSQRIFASDMVTTIAVGVILVATVGLIASFWLGKKLRRNS